MQLTCGRVDVSRWRRLPARRYGLLAARVYGQCHMGGVGVWAAEQAPDLAQLIGGQDMEDEEDEEEEEEEAMLEAEAQVQQRRW